MKYFITLLLSFSLDLVYSSQYLDSDQELIASQVSDNVQQENYKYFVIRNEEELQEAIGNCDSLKDQDFKEQLRSSLHYDFRNTALLFVRVKRENGASNELNFFIANDTLFCDLHRTVNTMAPELEPLINNREVVVRNPYEVVMMGVPKGRANTIVFRDVRTLYLD